jgi:hypothetical protein
MCINKYLRALLYKTSHKWAGPGVYKYWIPSYFLRVLRTQMGKSIAVVCPEPLGRVLEVGGEGRPQD